MYDGYMPARARIKVRPDLAPSASRFAAAAGEPESEMKRLSPKFGSKLPGTHPFEEASLVKLSSNYLGFDPAVRLVKRQLRCILPKR